MSVNGDRARIAAASTARAGRAQELSCEPERGDDRQRGGEAQRHQHRSGEDVGDHEDRRPPGLERHHEVVVLRAREPRPEELVLRDRQRDVAVAHHLGLEPVDGLVVIAGVEREDVALDRDRRDEGDHRDGDDDQDPAQRWARAFRGQHGGGVYRRGRSYRLRRPTL